MFRSIKQSFCLWVLKIAHNNLDEASDLIPSILPSAKSPASTTEFNYLSQRDQARDDGDKLAIRVREHLIGNFTDDDLRIALMQYCISQNWNGPTGGWASEIASYEKSERLIKCQSL